MYITGEKKILKFMIDFALKVEKLVQINNQKDAKKEVNSWKLSNSCDRYCKEVLCAAMP